LFLFVCIRLEAISKRIFWLKRTHFAGILEAKCLKKNIIIGIWSITFCISKHLYPAIIPIFCLSKKPAKRIFPSIGAIPHFLFSVKLSLLFASNSTIFLNFQKANLCF
jgi:hypothetical protein